MPLVFFDQEQCRLQNREQLHGVPHIGQSFRNAFPVCIVVIVDGQIDKIGNGLSAPLVTHLIQFTQTLRGSPQHIQIRLDKDTHSKFNTLTSVDKYYGATASCCPHFAGVTGEEDAVYLTEGVMKADIARYFSTVLGHPCAFVGLTGVSNINQYVRMLEELKRFGINTIKVAFDMDLHVNENVRKARDRVIQVGCENGFEVIPKRWSSNYKGIDDLLLSFIERRRITDSIFGRL